MKKWIIAGAVFLALCAGGAAFHFFFLQPKFAHAADLKDRWAKINPVTDRSLSHLLVSLKKANPKITAVSATMSQGGNMQIEIETAKTLSQDNRLQVSRKVMSILFANHGIHQIHMTTTKAGKHQIIIQMTASRNRFLKQPRKHNLAAGLKQLTIINKGR